MWLILLPRSGSTSLLLGFDITSVIYWFSIGCLAITAESVFYVLGVIHNEKINLIFLKRQNKTKEEVMSS